MIRTLIIDDEPIALEKLRTYTEKTPQLELVGACDSAFDAMEYVNKGDVDLIITDINMPDLNGLDFVRTLKNPPMVIFITAYADYAVESYSVSAVDYLLKPYGYVEFSRAVNKAVEAYALRHASRSVNEKKEDKDSIFFKVDYRYVRVSLADIRYIKGFGEYLQVYVV
ncbi:MAG: response regulator, partial [Muribaculaceae bacterium]|nr:response regulator [Muribaculaceae bacterium]